MTNLKSTTLVACLVCIIHLDESFIREQRFPVNGHSLVGFLRAYSDQEELEIEEVVKDEKMSVYLFKLPTTAALEGDVRVTGDSVVREYRMRVLFEAMKAVIRSL